MSKIDISKGRYWEEGICLVQGCTKCSPGCDNCWSIPLTRRFQHEHKISEGKNWTGLIRTRPDMLKKFNTRKPKVFAIWNDLFHEDVPDSFIEKTYMSMIDFSHNKYLILTKRPERMAKWVKMNWANNCIYHGLTVCNQQEADEKIPIFLQVPGKKFLSIEPMLGAITASPEVYDLHKDDDSPVGCKPCPCGKHWINIFSSFAMDCFDAVILGFETGHGARPGHPDWTRSVRDQCQNAGVDFFFKGWGEYIHGSSLPSENYLKGFKGKWEWAGEGKNSAIMARVGRKKAGRELDGKTHNQLPW